MLDFAKTHFLLKSLKIKSLVGPQSPVRNITTLLSNIVLWKVGFIYSQLLYIFKYLKILLNTSFNNIPNQRFDLLPPLHLS